MAQDAQPTPAQPPARLHLAHVDGLRALAALMVYLNHAYSLVWYPDRGQYPSGALEPLSYVLVTGHLSVAVFIVISGFCLALPVISAAGQLRGGAWAFFKRRARRILPPYYGAVALSLILIATVLGEPTGTLWDAPIAVDATSIVSHMLLLQNLFRTGSINYVFWSIAVEWQIYLVFPLIVLLWKWRGPAFTVLAMLLFGYALWFIGSGTRLARACPHFLGLFGLGMLAAYIARSSGAGYDRLRSAVPWRWCGALLLLMTLGLIVHWGIKSSVAHWYVLDLVVGLMATCLLVETSRQTPTRLTRALGIRPLSVVGTFSYSLYLIHAPLLQLMWQYALAPLGVGAEAMFAVLMSLGLALVLGASYLYFRVLEAPFMQQPQASRAETRAVVAPAVERIS